MVHRVDEMTDRETAVRLVHRVDEMTYCDTVVRLCFIELMKWQIVEQLWDCGS